MIRNLIPLIKNLRFQIFKRGFQLKKKVTKLYKFQLQLEI